MVGIGGILRLRRLRLTLSVSLYMGACTLTVTKAANEEKQWQNSRADQGCSRPHSRSSYHCFLGIHRSSGFVTAHTNPNAATIGCMKGTESQSTGGGRLDTLHLCRTCSTNDRTRRTICLLSAATSRRAGIGCAAVPKRRASSLLLAGDPKQLTTWTIHSRDFRLGSPSWRK